MRERLGCLVVLALLVFANAALGVSFVGFNPGLFYSIVGTTASPTVPVPLQVLFDQPVLADTFVPITTSDAASLQVTGGGVTLLAGQSNATVLLTATGLSPAVTLTGFYNSTMLTVTVSVVSSLPTVSLTLTTNGIGSVSVSPPGTSFPYGSVVNLTATPGMNQSFMGWSGSVTSTNNPLNITMNNDVAITANFAFATNNTPVAIALAAQISWFAQTNVNYQVQAATVLNTNLWFDLGSVVAGNNQTNFFYDLLGNSNRFYRVITRP